MVELGQIFTHRLSATDGIQWVVGLKNAENPDIFYILPIDDFDTFIGTWDVRTPLVEPKDYSLVTRCSRGIWIGELVLNYWLETDRARLFGKIGQESLIEIEKRIHALLGQGDVEVKEEIDYDPDYQEHLDLLDIFGSRMEESAIDAYQFVAFQRGIDVPVEWFRFKW